MSTPNAQAARRRARRLAGHSEDVSSHGRRGVVHEITSSRKGSLADDSCRKIRLATIYDVVLSSRASGRGAHTGCPIGAGAPLEHHIWRVSPLRAPYLALCAAGDVATPGSLAAPAATPGVILASHPLNEIPTRRDGRGCPEKRQPPPMLPTPERRRVFSTNRATHVSDATAVSVRDADQ